jgi:hydroxyacylglutathione hydrolase
MKHVNKVGPALLSALVAPAAVDRATIERAVADGSLVVDLRSQEAFIAGHIPGSLSVPMSAAMYSTYLGWFVDYTKPTYLVLPEGTDLATILHTLRTIGIDDIPGYLPAVALGASLMPLPTASLAELTEALRRHDTQILDVRGQTEYDAIHLPDALHIPLGFLPRQLAAIPRDRPVIVHCAAGYRAQVASSLLRRLGFTNVRNLIDPQGRWQELAATAVLA